jgi:hypothetical protein
MNGEGKHENYVLKTEGKRRMRVGRRGRKKERTVNKIA